MKNYLKIAKTIAENATCKKLKVGTVLVKNGLIVSTGYNGSASGEKHCIEEGCLIDKMGHCIRCVHSEANAIINCAKNGISTLGTTLYCTHKPCDKCSRLIINAGIKEVFYENYYKGDGSINLENFILVTKI